jgi:antitoxin MazE
MRSNNDILFKMYILEKSMRVAKWGNSLAVRLPKKLVEELGLKENDEIRLVPSPDRREVQIAQSGDARQARREAALKRLAELRWQLPADYEFDREEANARRGFSEPE